MPRECPPGHRLVIIPQVGVKPWNWKTIAVPIVAPLVPAWHTEAKRLHALKLSVRAIAKLVGKGKSQVAHVLSVAVVNTTTLRMRVRGTGQHV